MSLTTRPKRNMNEVRTTETLTKAYRLIASLWCSPQDVEIGEVRQGALSLVSELREADGESAELLSRFLDQPPITEEEYVELFELSPQCALYLGSHVFEEPKTCAEAANSDRSEYMVDLKNMYKHFGLEIDKQELPDFLPIMVEFLGLTAQSRHDAVRQKFIKEYMVPFMKPLCSRLDQLKTPYFDLGQALSAIVQTDLVQTDLVQTDLTPTEDSGS